MLIIINDDPAFLSWISHHRLGFVLDSFRKPAKRHLVWHRATCAELKASHHRRPTSGTHIKLCSLDATELADWAREATGGELQPCDQCHPDRELHAEDLTDPEQAEHPHLTLMGQHALNYVLEVAAMRLGGESPDYGLTVGMIAAALSKSPAQVSPALFRLIAAGEITVTGELVPDTALPVRALVFPTRQALRTLPVYADWTDDQLDAELSKLAPR